MNFFETLINVTPNFLPFLLEGAGVAIKIAVGAFILAIIVGIFLALMLVAQASPIRFLARSYVELIRGTPALTQLFIIYFGLSEIGLSLSPMAAAIIGLGANGAAYLAEIFRAGIGAIDKGQKEAAASLGLPPIEVMRFIILPQAIRIMLPPLVNYAVQLLKDTTLASSVAAPEIMFRARNLVMETYLSMQIYVLVACIYLAISIPLSRLASRLQKSIVSGTQ
jgi:polar amino acid transport system permease protein/cystine transport system permease protein